MMIQLLVENAIKHGMKSKKKGEGKIEINLEKLHALEVIINDKSARELIMKPRIKEYMRFSVCKLQEKNAVYKRDIEK
ncbi:MAG: hypothetical protein R2766_01105 [Saprospiraceae bacterium]